jgi:hypothetical protein
MCIDIVDCPNGLNPQKPCYKENKDDGKLPKELART